jgi:hypothetical protein
VRACDASILGCTGETLFPRDDNSLFVTLINKQTLQSRPLHDGNIRAIQTLKRDLLVTMRAHRDDALQSDGATMRTPGDQMTKLASRSTILDKSEHILVSFYCEKVYRREFVVSDAANKTLSWGFKSWCTGHCLDCGCSCTERA